MQSVYPFRYEAGNGYGKLQATIINLGITMGFSEYYTTHSTKEIADVSDFFRNRFCTVFEKHFGTTPLSYRKNAP